ncbi:MAG: hypothetical protein R2849_02400 [Thermomicrobiales bacterium]
MFEFLVGDFSIVAGATLALIAFWRLFPFAVNRILQILRHTAAISTVASLLTAAAAILWIAAFDNWRQVIGILTGWIQDDKAQRASDPFYSATFPIRSAP